MAITSRMVRYATDVEDLREALDEASSIIRRTRAKEMDAELITQTGSTIRLELQMRDTVPPTFRLVLS